MHELTEVDVLTIKAKISGLRFAREKLKNQSRNQRREGVLPWTTDDSKNHGDPREKISQAIMQIEDEIIGLEYSLRDPYQDAELRAEINAAIAMSGNYGDSADYYMHTDMEEELFKESIYRQVYYEDGHMEYGPFSCPTCNAYPVYDDEILYINGDEVCSCCEERVTKLAEMVAAEFGWELQHNRYGYTTVNPSVDDALV